MPFRNVAEQVPLLAVQLVMPTGELPIEPVPPVFVTPTDKVNGAGEKVTVAVSAEV